MSHLPCRRHLLFKKIAFCSLCASRFENNCVDTDGLIIKRKVCANDVRPFAHTFILNAHKSDCVKLVIYFFVLFVVVFLLMSHCFVCELTMI